MKDLLEVIRVQRHNFLNHLQVISGLLQLKKHDRIMDYIIQIGNEYNQDSLVGRLEVPEITVAILSSDLTAGKQGIIINKKITTGLDKGMRNAAEAAEMLKEMLNISISVVEKVGCRQREIELKVKEEAEKYIFSVRLPASDLKEEIACEMRALIQKSHVFNGEIGIDSDNDLMVLTLKVPICDNNTDK